MTPSGTQPYVSPIPFLGSISIRWSRHGTEPVRWAEFTTLEPASPGMCLPGDNIVYKLMESSWGILLEYPSRATTLPPPPALGLGAA